MILDINQYIKDDNGHLILSRKDISEHDFNPDTQWPPTRHTALQSIDLSRNCFKRIPPQIFSYTSLTHLDISRNALTGIPSEIKQLINLEKLIALSNHLRLRQLPIDEFSSLHSLRILDLRYNRKLKQSAY
ncbi:hypothetical protein ACHAWC_002324, partial [Mediolabrus comicus]